MALHDTERIIAADQRHLLHPYQIFDTYLTDPVLPIADGVGALLLDTNGNEYLDAVGGMWCTNIGLGRNEMADAIADQVRQLAYANPFADMTNVPAVDLAEKLAELAPGSLNHVFFTCGGSTAIDSAFRLIQFYWDAKGPARADPHPEPGRRLPRHHLCVGLDRWQAGRQAAGVRVHDRHDPSPQLAEPLPVRERRSEQEFADDLIAELEATVAELGGPQHVAAMFAEPMMGSGGVIVPPADYLQRAWRFCKDNDILFVADEVVTGFGRLGEWFVSDTIFGIQPDMITSAKGLTSGYLPLGALIFSDEVFDVIAEEGHGRYFAVGYTYSGHPVSCAAALKNIEIIEREGLLDHVKDVGPYFMERSRRSPIFRWSATCAVRT